MHTIIIRAPRRDEYGDVAQVVTSELAQWQTVLTDAELEELGIGQETADDLLAGESTRHYLVAEHVGQIIGFVSWSMRTPKVAWVSMLQVLPEFQSQGVGSALLAYVEEEVRKHGGIAIALETQKKATWAQQFYEKKGFHILSDDDLRFETYYRAILTRPLEPSQPYWVWGKRLSNGGSAGGLIVREQDGAKEVLLVSRGDNRWVFPKGHIDAGESADEAAIREVYEETGFVAEIVRELGSIYRGTKKEDGSVKDVRPIKIFLMTIVKHDDLMEPEEEYAWFTYDKAVELMCYDEDREFLTNQQSLFT